MNAPGNLPALVLRDIHQPPPPPWWPPAPGWWLLGGLLLLLAGAWSLLAWRRRRRRMALARLFDAQVAAAATPAAQVAAMSELLRRAALQRDPRAATLQGDAWLGFLDDGNVPPLFAGDAGRVLLEGGFRAEVDPAAIEALRPLARQRFLQWLGAR
jgi:hypothetical protein